MEDWCGSIITKNATDRNLPRTIMPPTRDFHFSIDRGGTFTDVFAEVGDGPSPHDDGRPDMLCALSSTIYSYVGLPRSPMHVAGHRSGTENQLFTTLCRS